MSRSASVSATAARDAMPRTARHAPAHARRPRRQVLAGTARRAWRGWRRSRPFWGALAVVAGGAEIAVVRLTAGGGRLDPLVPLGLLIAAGLIGCGLLLVFGPVQRSLYSTAAVLLAVVGLSTVHVGGYLIGSVLGAAGGALAFAWVPAAPPAVGGPPPGGPQTLTLILGEAGIGADHDGPAGQARAPADGPGAPGAV
ncbi:MAG TPA: DUF6114 domain-containing protein [Streptosporangiaceae bacterium]|nr:DUF6114 domain-containing protein [Streptosporangiaceae bacterium]